jgi:photosystem II protein
MLNRPSLAVRRSNAVTTRAGPLDNFSKQLKKKADYDPSGKEVQSPESAFTRRREVIAGRLAMTGFFAELVGELFTGKGAVGQLSLETLLPRPLIGGLIVALVLFNFATALNPASPTFSESNQQDVRKRPAGGVQKPGKVDPTQNPKQALGISNSFGFTKANELFVGRLAMIGFAASLIGEYFQPGSRGPLGQLGIPMPAYAEYAGFGLAGWILFFFAAAVGSGNFPGEVEGGEDIY